MTQKIGIACDHAAYELKEFLVGYLSTKGYDVVEKRQLTIPSEITELEKQLSVIMQKKLTAAKNQNFELAAGYREKEINIQSEIKRLTEKELKR